MALALAATTAIVLLSAYIRLSQAGAGCDPWPACFGRVASETSAFAPTRTASQVHRLIASALSLIVVGLAIASLRRPRSGGRVAHAWLALGLAGFLAILGVYTPRSALPGVTIGNLLGGFALLAVLWRLYLRELALSSPKAGGSQTSGVVGLVAVLLAIATGAIGASYLAAGACVQDCPGLPSVTTLATVDLFNAPTADARVALAPHVHALHRAVAVLTTLYLMVAAWRLRATHARYALLVSGVVLAQTVIGAAQSRFGMPLSLGVAHNTLAAVLLLALLAGLRCRRTVID